LTSFVNNEIRCAVVNTDVDELVLVIMETPIIDVFGNAELNGGANPH
jgi:hypothetical protein